MLHQIGIFLLLTSLNEVGADGLHKTHAEPPRDKTNKVTVHPAKTQISLDIRPVWSVFAVRSVGS